MNNLALQLIAENNLAKTLDLSNCGMEEIPSTITNLKCLDQLIITNRKDYYDYDNYTLVPVRYISKSHNSFETFPVGFGDLPITKLVIVGNDNKELKKLDIREIGKLKNLRFLVLRNVLLTDITPLAGLINLEVLDIAVNEISDISPLTGLAGLTRLHVFDNLIVSLSGIEKLRNLTEFNCSENKISDITPLSVLANLTWLSFAINNVKVLKPVASLSNLMVLNFHKNDIEDISSIARLTKLKELFFQQNRIADISPITELNNLKQIIFHTNKVEDISPLSRLYHIEEINCSHNLVQDVSILSALPKLRRLIFNNCLVSHLKPLVRFPALQQFSCYGCPVSDAPLKAFSTGDIDKLRSYFPKAKPREKQTVGFKKPAFRKLRGYAFDPSLSTNVDTVEINDIIYKVPWEEVGLGPVGEYVEVIDYDPTVKRFYKPVDLNDKYILAQDGLDPSEGNPQFHQQMVYAVAMTTINNFERALGRKILWATHILSSGEVYEEYVAKLRLYPHALREANAYYSPVKKSLLFGYFASSPADASVAMNGALVFTCLSHDIIAHEVTHAILDGMHRNYNNPTNPDVLAFHEAFADVVALFQHFTFSDVLKHQVAKTRGQLETQNLLGQLAQEFGTAIGSYGSLRDALGEIDSETKVWKPKKPDPNDYRTTIEPHARGSILVAAVFDAFVTIYKKRIADLQRIASGGTGILQQGELHPDLVNRLAIEASKAASHILHMCIRAIDYCPPVDITFGDYLRAIITADMDLISDDSLDYRIAFIEAFRRRGIYPEGIKTLSEDSLRQPLLNIGTTENETPDNEPSVEEIGNVNVKSESSSAGKKSHLLTSQIKMTIDDETEELLVTIIKFLRDYADAIKYVNDRQKIFEITRKYISGGQDVKGLHQRLQVKFSRSLYFSKLTGLGFHQNYNKLGINRSQRYTGPSFQIQNLRLVSRVGPDGNQINQVVFSIVQKSILIFSNGKFKEAYSPASLDSDPLVSPKPLPPEAFKFTGGCTLIFDLDTVKLKYAISKPLISFENDDINNQICINRKRVEEQYNYQHSEFIEGFNEYSLYFGNGINNLSEPFSFLHHH